MKLETIAIADLIPDPNNARTHDQKNLEAIAGSLKEFGQRKPIVITKENMIAAGNGTVAAAKSLGWNEIEVVRVPADWDADRIKAFALADNRTAELAQWDQLIMASQLLELQEAGFQIEEFGFELAEPIKEINDEDESLDFEDAPERASLGDHWRIGRHEVICGSSLDPEIISKFQVNFDAVITDPPYGINANKMNLGATKKTKNKFHRGEGWDEKTPPISWVLDLAPKVIIWGGNYFTNELSPTNDWLIWYKKIANMSFSECEMAWTNLNKQTRLLAHHWSGEEKRHVTMKPSPVMDWCCSFFPSGSRVLDVFAGSGSTLLAAERAGQIGYGIELDPKYVDVILDRLEKQTGQKAELVNASR